MRETIREGAPRVEKLLGLLESDALTFSEGVYKNAAQRILNKYMSYYNEHFAQQSLDEASAMSANRMEFLRRAQVSAERYNTALELNPSVALTKMRKVNKDLLDWAIAPKKQPFDINQLADDIDSCLAFLVLGISVHFRDCQCTGLAIKSGVDFGDKQWIILAEVQDSHRSQTVSTVPSHSALSYLASIPTKLRPSAEQQTCRLQPLSGSFRKVSERQSCSPHRLVPASLAVGPENYLKASWHLLDLAHVVLGQHLLERISIMDIQSVKL